jgi:uncharacterized membrane protein
MNKHKFSVPVAPDQGSLEKNRLGLERLIFFSDAVFAIAITILVLDIRLPPGGESANNTELFHLLVGLWHKYLAYVLSFWVIGLYWTSHHRKFLLIKRFDNRLLTLNLLVLMVIAFIPFPTAVLSENANRTATIFYALIMALGGLLMLLLWWHAVRNDNLIDHHLDRRILWREVASPLATVAIFLLSIGLAFVDEGLVRLCWFLLLPVTIFLNRRKSVLEPQK